MPTISAADIVSAYDKLDGKNIVQRTPIEYSRALSKMSGAEVHLKMEHLQRTGSFKTRGAYNKLQNIVSRDDIDSVVAASAGNHAQGVALAATETGTSATIVMPTTAPQTKIEATRGYGATVVLKGLNFEAAADHAESLSKRPNTELIHAFDDPAIVAGQGTLGLELLEDIPELETVVVPIGGGGLIAGIGTILAEKRPDVRVIGVQAASAATVPDSLDKGKPISIDDVDTIADGIATGSTSEFTLSLIREHVDEVVTVTDEEIATGIVLLLERAKQLVEGAGATPVAALASGKIDASNETVVPILSGGNIDISLVKTILTHELTSRSQLIRLRVKIDDKPGQMALISDKIAEQSANIRTIHHIRADDALSVGEAHLEFLVETSGESHAAAIIESIEKEGFVVNFVN